jgi:GT2 family glycosyltransferase
MDNNSKPDNVNAKKLSVIIVNYNGHDYLKKCLKSLEKFALPGSGYSSETVVVDNASTDGSVEMTEKFFRSVKIIRNNSNKGFASAVNSGIESTFSEFILLLNSDCEVYGNSLRMLVDFMDGNSCAGVAGPKILNSDGSVQLSCRKFPALMDAAMHAIIGSVKPDNVFSRRYKLAEIPKEDTFMVDWVSGSCMMIRRDSLIDTGLMDEKYFMYVEDADLCWRMWKEGWKVYYFPESRILHHSGKSTKKGGIKSVITMQKSTAYFFRKNYRQTAKILLYPLLLVVLGMRILLTFIKNLLK